PFSALACHNFKMSPQLASPRLVILIPEVGPLNSCHDPIRYLQALKLLVQPLYHSGRCQPTFGNIKSSWLLWFSWFLTKTLYLTQAVRLKRLRVAFPCWLPNVDRYIIRIISPDASKLHNFSS